MAFWNPSVLVAVTVLGSGPAQVASSADVVAASAKAMGTEGLSSIHYWGSASSYVLGQNTDPDGPWPRTNIDGYSLTVDFRKPVWRGRGTTFTEPGPGGPAKLSSIEQYLGPEQIAWPLQYGIWTTPWGFLIGARKHQVEPKKAMIDGRQFDVVTWHPDAKAPSGKAYSVTGYIGPTKLVERVDTWIEMPLLGDVLIRHRYSDWRDSKGLKFPTTTAIEAGGHPFFELQTAGAEGNPPDLAELVAPPIADTSSPAAQPQSGPASEQLAPGVWRILGAYNALAVEFKDYAVIFEPGAVDNARAKAVIEETKRLMPGKPVRYGVVSHHHIDHAAGLPAVAAAGVTIVTASENVAFLKAALNSPRTLARDGTASSAAKPTFDPVGLNRVFDDGVHRLEILRIEGLPHADGMLIGWLPHERILIYADMYIPAAKGTPPGPSQIFAAKVMAENMARLGLRPDQIISVHRQAGDAPISVAAIETLAGSK